jgi:hypothetical protein
MVGSPIIEVIIGMVFVYSLLSILVTQINTVITNVLKLRAIHLKQGLKQMLADPTIRARFLTHPLVGLVRRPLNPRRPLSAQGAEMIVESDTAPVTWIDKTIFSEVMLELINAQAPLDKVQIYGALLKVADEVLTGSEKAQVRALVRQMETSGTGIDDLKLIIDNLRDPADRQAMNDALSEATHLQAEYNTSSSDIVNIIKGIRAIPNKELQRALDTLLASATNLVEVRRRLERWFDYNMDLVAQEFQRSIQKYTLIVAVIMTLLLNIDTLQIALSLWNDPALRDTVAVAARTSLETQQEAQENLIEAEAAQSRAPSALMSPSHIASQQAELQQAQRELDESVKQTRDTLTNLLELRLPLGWGYAPVTQELIIGASVDNPPLLDTRNLWNYFPFNNPNNWLSLIVSKIAGLLLTVLAISQGAPFWFDLLKRVTGRGGGTAPQQTPSTTG